MGAGPNANQIPKVVKHNKALKFAETWVNSMTTSASVEQSEVEFEGRRALNVAQLGLGAKLALKAKVAVSVEQAERRLLGKLNSRRNCLQNTTPVKEDAPSEEDEPESRTRAFVKRRSISLPVYQEEKMMFPLGGLMVSVSNVASMKSKG